MDNVKRLFLSFLCWVVALLAAFAQMVVSLVPKATFGKPLAFIVSVVVIAAIVAAKIFDPSFTKKVTSATGT